MSQSEVIAGLPSHLRAFAATQDYSLYTPRDQAIWRFLLQQLKYKLVRSAHPTYLDGLAKTGITLDAIPRIEHINDCLTKIGWRAVVVDGFLPPAIFMEFQAIKVLVIAVNIRSFEHMLYTPAPDIIHESAGHAPFLIDIDYAEFLQRFGELGMRAISNQHDLNVYEAVRKLSIVKEKEGASAKEISNAEHALQALENRTPEPSEANLLARLHWWTVEYGLVGTVDNYSIYGAGLLSSLAESESCLNDQEVKKRALTIDAIKTSYNITDPQPQLFVTESCRHLSQVLEEYGRHMCCNRGGTSALIEAKNSGSVNTIRLNSGIQISGVVNNIECDAVGNTTYFNTTGATQLAYRNIELTDQGIRHHPHGFGSPVGKLISMERCLSEYTVDELSRHGIQIGHPVELNFLSGINVYGTLTHIVRRDQKNIVFTFESCAVQDTNKQTLFDPDWGVYDMAVGNTVVSLSGGSADQTKYPLFEAPSQQTTVKQQYDDATMAQFELYSKLRDCRKSQTRIEPLITEINNLESADWLLLFEALELTQDQAELKQHSDQLLAKLSTLEGNEAQLVEQGLKRIGVNP